jgi:hypothetical protein
MLSGNRKFGSIFILQPGHAGTAVLLPGNFT